MSSITLTPQMLAVLDSATVARLQALVAMMPVATPAAVATEAVAVPVSERHALMLEGVGVAMAEMKAKKTLSPEHLAKMKAGREAAKLKKQLVAPLVSKAALEAAETRFEAALEAEVVASLAVAHLDRPPPPAEWGPEVQAAEAALDTLQALQALAPLATAAPVKESKKGMPTAWADWVKKNIAERKDEIAAYKEAAEKKAGASLKWIAANLGKTSPEWLAFKAQWTQTHTKPAEPMAVAAELPVLLVAEAPVVAPVVAPVALPVALPVAAPMVITVVNDSIAADTEPESDNEPVVTPPIKKRGPKPLASMTPAERAAHDAKVAERKAAKEAKAAAAAAATQSVGGGANSAH